MFIQLCYFFAQSLLLALVLVKIFWWKETESKTQSGLGNKQNFIGSHHQRSQSRWTSDKSGPRDSMQSSGAWFLLLTPVHLPECPLYSKAVFPLSHSESCTVVSALLITFLGFILFGQSLELSPNGHWRLMGNGEGTLRQQSYIYTKALCC